MWHSHLPIRIGTSPRLYNFLKFVVTITPSFFFLAHTPARGAFTTGFSFGFMVLEAKVIFGFCTFLIGCTLLSSFCTLFAGWGYRATCFGVVMILGFKAYPLLPTSTWRPHAPIARSGPNPIVFLCCSKINGSFRDRSPPQ